VSRQDLWTVVGRARLDLDFGGRLQQDFDHTITEAGYSLDGDDLRDAREVVQRLFLSAGAGPITPGGGPPDLPDMQVMQKLRLAQAERMGRLTDFMFENVKKTFIYARLTYKSVTWMNWLMFGTGIGLFVFAAFYAAYSHEKIYSLLFGGLGVSSFITLFMLGPIDKSQRALSNLVQAEIAFMNYFDQQSFWEGYANIPRGMPPGPDPANIERASAALQERSRETIELLQRYVEEEKPRRGWRRAKKDGERTAVTP
jgi:hypothetical protein